MCALHMQCALDPIFRELVVSWGDVLLFEIETDEMITVLAVRHQKEWDWV